MYGVLDTSAVTHLARSYQPASGTAPCDAVTSLVVAGTFVAVVDLGMALVDEWRRTAGWEFVEVLFVRWGDAGGIVTIDPQALPRSVAQKLRRLGFTDTIDKLVVRIAAAAPERNVISEDPDFWDPADTGSKGDCKARVARLLHTELGITVAVLRELVESLRG